MSRSPARPGGQAAPESLRPAAPETAPVHARDGTAAARIEAAFGDSTPAIRRFAWLAAAVMALAFLAHVARTIAEINAPGFGGEAVRLDFTAFWAAAKLALAGDAAAAFEPDRLREALSLPPGMPPGDLIWLYPPAWHMAVAPLGLLSFPAAYLVYSAAAFAAFAATIRPLARPLPGGSPLVLAAPAVLIALLLGNMSLLWTAGLAGALGAAAAGQAALAGLLIALLTVKPQLGLLVPVALAAGGHWRVILWALLCTAALLALSTAVMGVGYWRHFFDAMGLMSGLMTTGVVEFKGMMTWYAMFRTGGAPHAPALTAQVAIALAAAAAVGWVWSRPHASADLMAAALCAAIPLATPYAYHYEMTLTLAAALFLARDGFGASRGARLWLLLLWLGPAVNLALAGWLAPALYAAPLVTLTLGLCVARTSRARHAAA